MYSLAKCATLERTNALLAKISSDFDGTSRLSTTILNTCVLKEASRKECASLPDDRVAT